MVIERPPEEVFAYVSDLQNIAEWGTLSGEMQKETEEPPEVGARYTADLTFLGRRLVISYEVSANEPPRLFDSGAWVARSTTSILTPSKRSQKEEGHAFGWL